MYAFPIIYHDFPSLKSNLIASFAISTLFSTFVFRAYPSPIYLKIIDFDLKRFLFFLHFKIINYEFYQKLLFLLPHYMLLKHLHNFSFSIKYVLEHPKFSKNTDWVLSILIMTLLLLFHNLVWYLRLYLLNNILRLSHQHLDLFNIKQTVLKFTVFF